MYLHFCVLGILLSRATFAAPTFNEERAPCTVLSEGFEAVDDALAINNAIAECGDRGTIVLPAGQIYSIRSPIDFSPCRDCEVQLESELLMSDDETFWNNKPGFVLFSNVSGANFRSLTGKGLINGNTDTFYQRGRGTYLAENQPVLVPILNSTNIVIDGLTLKNARKQFFRTDSQSSHVQLSNLHLTVANQWYQDIWTRAESIGFQFRNSSAISLDSIYVDFRSAGPDAKVGVCAAVDYSTSDISINNITCNNTSHGVLMQFGSVRKDPPPAADQWSKNIYISNYITNSTENSGFKHLLGFDYAKVENLTYDGVNIISGNALVNSNCYVITNGVTNVCSEGPNGYLRNLQANFTDIWFKNYKGRVGEPALQCSYHSTCDFHFAGWLSQASS